MNFNHSIEAVLAQTLLHSLWQIAVLGLLAAMLLGLLHRLSAALKHVVGMAFLFLMMAAPVQTFLLLTAENANVVTIAHTDGVLPLLLPVMLNVPQITSSTSGLVLPWLWCAGVIFMLVRLIGGWWMLRKLDRQTAIALPSVWQQRAQSLRVALGIRRDVTIKLLQDMGLPCTARAWHPIVWLPVSILTQLTPDQIEALIAHELAHIHRLDWIWNAMQCLAEAVLFYHPAVWWLNRRIRQERENACDDLAVAVCGDAIVLAEALAILERNRSPVHMLVLSSDGGSLMQRITRLLSPGTPAKFRWAVPMGLMALLCTGVFLAAQASYATGNGSASTDDLSWWTHVGESSEIRETNDQGVSRVYHKWIDLSGNPHETFRVNGKLVPIDKSVRLWVKQQIASNRPPAPPAPPPPPPAPPSMTESVVVQAAVQAARQDSRMVTALGSSIIAESIHGPSYSDEDEARLSLVMSGSKGRAEVQVIGEKTDGVWVFNTFDIDSLESFAK